MDRSVRVAAAVRAARAAVAELDEALTAGGSGLSQQEWLDVVGACQGLSNRVSGVQDVAIARSARFERTYAEDGTATVVERGPGRVALDAADLVAPRLGVSHQHAQARMEDAVRLGGREPLPVEVDARPGRTGVEALSVAMRAGLLDRYRAVVVAEELGEATAPVARAVVAALEPHLGTEPAAGLRRRTRRVLARISPDLLVQRARRARAETGLRRWVAEPGVDAWHGTFPTEDSAAAWAAVDALARRYLTDGTRPTIEAARGKALTDLVTGHADVRVRLVLTTPAHDTDTETDTDGDTEDRPSRAAADGSADGDGTFGPSRAEDLVQALGIRPSGPMLVARGWLDHLAADPHTDLVRRPCHPGTGARTDPGDTLAGDVYRPGAQLRELVQARDGRCRFPGCHVSARFCDLDHARPWPTGPTSATNLLCLCRRHHRVKQAPGWQLCLYPDATARWTDPTGVTTTTEPLDALDHVVLPAHLDPRPRERTGIPTPPDPLTEHRHRLLEQRDALIRHHGGRCTLDELPDHLARLHGTHRPRAPATHGPPPF